MKIKRVPVVALLQLLEDLYDKGVDYVDVHGKHLSEDQDVIGVSFSKDYMDSECLENFEDFVSEDSPEEEKDSNEVKISLKDENLDELI